MAEIVRMHTSTGFFCAVLGKPGRIYTPYVTLQTFPIRKRKIRNTALPKVTAPLMRKDKPYPLKRGVNQMLRVGRNVGITKGAKTLLKGSLI